MSAELVAGENGDSRNPTGELTDPGDSDAPLYSVSVSSNELAVVPPVVPLAENPAAVYLARLAPGSRRTMRQALDTIAALAADVDALSCPWHELRYQHTAAIRAQLASSYAPATANKLLSALRGVLEEAWRLGLMSAEDHRAAADVRNVRGQTLPAGRSLSKGEVSALLASCGDGMASQRDAALIAVLYGTGARRSEAVAFDLADYDIIDGALLVRGGKGAKDRRLFLPEDAALRLDRWVALRLALPGTAAGPLFVPIDKAGHLSARRLTGQAVLLILQRRATLAGISHFSPHDLRRTFAGDMLDAGVDLVTLQGMMGHANPATTGRYDRRGDRAKRRAASLLRF